MNDLNGATWRKSVRSSTGNCVEVAVLSGVVGVRDSKDGGAGPVLTFASSTWAVFLTAAKAGAFDAT